MELVLLWLLFGIAGAAMLGLIIAWVMRRNWQADQAAAAAKDKEEAERKNARNRQYAQRDARIRNYRACPYCAERILKKARVCKHCGRDVEPIG